MNLINIALKFLAWHIWLFLLESRKIYDEQDDESKSFLSLSSLHEMKKIIFELLADDLNNKELLTDPAEIRKKMATLHPFDFLNPLHIFLQNNPSMQLIILFALAPDIDRRFFKLYGYLNEDSNKRTSVSLAMELFGKEIGIEIFWRLFSNRSFFVFFELLDFDSPVVNSETNFALNERIRETLLDNQCISNNLGGIVETIETDEITISACSSGLSQRLNLFMTDNKKSTHSIFCLYGEASYDKKIFVQHVARNFQKKILLVETSKILQRTSSYQNLENQRIIRNIIREAYLQSGIIFFQDTSDGSDSIEQYKNILEVIQSLPNSLPPLLIFLSTREEWFPKSTAKYSWQIIQFSLPSSQEQFCKWQEAIPQYSKEKIARLVTKFPMTIHEIQELAEYSSKYEIDVEHQLYVRFKPETIPGIQKVEPYYNWDDLVLAEPQKAQLSQILNRIKYHYQVYQNWDFQKKFASHSFNCLFSGPPGSGKTMSVFVLAKELGVELYIIKLSTVLSKWVGESQKILESIFQKYVSWRAILLIDEADGLLARRSTRIESANDRFSNLEINFLLESSETHNGIIFFATNLLENIDPAMLRRFDFCVKFQAADAAQRRKIWQNSFPTSTPLSSNINYDLLAEKLLLSGSDIKKIALNAAFLATSNQSFSIELKHICEAVKCEYEKQGKIFPKDLIWE